MRGGGDDGGGGRQQQQQQRQQQHRAIDVRKLPYGTIERRLRAEEEMRLLRYAVVGSVGDDDDDEFVLDRGGRIQIDSGMEVSFDLSSQMIPTT